MRGIERIAGAFAEGGDIRLMTHAVCGYPDMAGSAAILASMADSGAAIIEAQIPFSEPSADGPLIVEANHAALRRGAGTKACLAMLGELRRRTGTPILVMSYLNPLVSFGPEAFVSALVDAGIDGAIVPDLPDDEPEPPLRKLFASAGLAFVPLIAPSTSPERAGLLARSAGSPLVYVVMRLGVTGRRTEIDQASRDRLEELRRATGLRLAAGFGIRDRAQVEALRGSADCAIVGSALLAEARRAIAAGEDPARAVGTLVEVLVGRR